MRGLHEAKISSTWNHRNIFWWKRGFGMFGMKSNINLSSLSLDSLLIFDILSGQNKLYLIKNYETAVECLRTLAQWINLMECLSFESHWAAFLNNHSKTQGDGQIIWIFCRDSPFKLDCFQFIQVRIQVKSEKSNWLKLIAKFEWNFDYITWKLHLPPLFYSIFCFAG